MNNSQSQSYVKDSMNYIASQMPSFDKYATNPIENLSIDDIIYLQTYLEKIKSSKQMSGAQRAQPTSRQVGSGQWPNGQRSNVQQVGNGQQMPNAAIQRNRATDIYNPLGLQNPVDWRDLTSRTQEHERQMPNQSYEPGPRGATQTRSARRSDSDYYNPYEYGARQNGLGPTHREAYNGPYSIDPQHQIELPASQLYEKFPGQIRNVNIENSLLQSEPNRLPGQRIATEREMDRFQMLPFNPQNPDNIVWADNMPRGGYASRTDRIDQ